VGATLIGIFPKCRNTFTEFSGFVKPRIIFHGNYHMADVPTGRRDKRDKYELQQLENAVMALQKILE
jgi:hypothetical protein